MSLNRASDAEYIASIVFLLTEDIFTVYYVLTVIVFSSYTKHACSLTLLCHPNPPIFYKFLVSKETVVLRRWDTEK